MPVPKKIRDFLDSEIAHETHRQLVAMENDPTFATTESYTPNTKQYPSNSMTFAEKHMDYLSNHLQVSTQTYLANLRLKTRTRAK